MSTPEDDPLLADIAAQARADGEAPPMDTRWDALAAGRLAPEDEADLRASEEGARPENWAAFAPLGEAARARFTDAALSALSGGAEAGREEAVNEGGAKVVPLRSARRRVWWAAAGVGLALAAAALVWVTPGPTPIPPYSVDVRGGVAIVRGAGDEPAASDAPTLRPSTQLSIALVPAEPVEGSVDVRAVVLGGDSARPWSPTVRVSAEGALRIEGTAAALGLTTLGAGPRTLRIVYGRPGALPSADGDTPPSGEGWASVDVEVVLAP